MRLKYFAIFSLLFVLKGHINAQGEIRFNHLTTDNGLTNNIVSCTLQDSAGYIWFGTIDGLCRYDGNTFVSYLHKNRDSNSIADNEITCLCEDAGHRVWIGTTYGLSCFNPVTKKFTNYYFDKTAKKPGSDYISVLYPDSRGIIWVGTRKGLYKIDPSSGQCTNIKITPDKFNTIFIHGIGSTKDGRLFVAFVSDVLYSDDGGNSFTAAPDISNRIQKNHVSSFYIDGKERLWVGVWDHSILYEINAHTLAVTPHVFDTATVKDHPGNSAHVIRLLNDTILMIGTIVSGDMQGGCLYFFNTKKDKCIKYLHNAHNPYSISSNHIYSLYIDKQQTVWVGTLNGVNYFNRRLSNFNQLTSPEGDDSTLFSGYTLLANDSKGNLWMAANNKILYYKAYDKNSFPSAKPEIEATIPKPIDGIISICPVGDSVLMGTTRGIIIFNITKKTFDCSPVLPDSLKIIQRYSMPSIYKDKKGVIWFGTFQIGVFSYNPVNKEIRRYYLHKEDANPQNKNTIYVESLSGDADGNIWAGTSDDGYYRISPSSRKVDFNPGLDSKTDYKSLGEIGDIFCDTNNLVYIATTRDGLLELSGQDKRTSYYTVEDGLSNDDVARIIPWGKNYLLLPTKKGLSVFNKANKTFRNYFRANGLFTDYFRSNGGLINSGEVFVSSDNCLEYFDPSSLLDSNLKIYPGFTSMQVNNKEYTGDLSQKISLGYRDNIISFTFSAFDFINNAEDKFAYKLEGLEDDWNYCGSRHYAEYTNLPGGNYILKLKVQTTDGNWVETARPIFLHIATPYWKTWWFFMLCGIAAFALGYLFYYLKMQRKLEAEKLRTRLARDLHDDIGSSLSSISILSDMAGKSKSASAEETQLIFNKISESSHKTMESMKDIVWTVNPENDAVESLLTHMRIYCSEILESKGIEYEFKTDKDVENIKLAMEQRRNFYLIFKETVNNIAKYSKCSKVGITIYKSDDKIGMKITDNGIGFDAVNAINKGNGLKNMNERAKLMNGNFAIESSEGTGTSTTLVFPLT